MIPDETVDQIRRASPLADVVRGAGIELKRRGAELVGLCPFHDDHHPSLRVNETKGLWHCDPCGKGGDVFKWVMLREGLAFPQAVEKLARRAGILLNGEGGAAAARHSTVERPTPTEQAEHDLSEPWRGCVAAFTDEHVTKLATWRGLSVEFVRWLRDSGRVGLFEEHVAFPVHDEAGRVVGIHYRVKPKADGERAGWRYEGGCSVHPLVVGDPKRAASILCFESQWDGFAVMDKLGWHKAAPDAEAVVITRGASNGKLAAGLCAPDAALLAFAQNDKAGADWLRDVAEHAGCKVMAVATPTEHKDINEWTRAGATKDDIMLAINKAAAISPSPAPLANTEIKDGMAGSLVDATALHALAVEPREYIVRPFFKVGDLGFVYGRRGDGKTWLTMLLAQAGATAGVVGPWKAERQYRILYVDGEMPAEETKRRDKALGSAAGGNLVFLHHEIYFERTGRTLNLADPVQQDALTRLLVEENFRALILDNLSCLFSGLKENDADSWEMVLPWLLKLRRLKIAVMIVAHAGRNGQMRGTSRREDQAFWVIKLERGDGDGARCLRFTSMFTKNRNALEDDCPPLEWTITKQADGTASVTAKTVSGVELLVSWVNAGLDSASDIAQEMGLTKGTVSKLAKRAEAQGRITIKHRRYLPAGAEVDDE